MIRLVIGRFATTAKIMFLKPYQLALCDSLPDTDQNQQDSGRRVKQAKNALYRCASLLNELQGSVSREDGSDSDDRKGERHANHHRTGENKPGLGYSG